VARPTVAALDARYPVHTPPAWWDRVVRGDGNGWVICGRGHRHWGRFGAAGLLVRHREAGLDRVVLQHRVGWSHHGGTWGVPGGARDSHEPAVDAALREAAEEAGIGPASVRPVGLLRDDHGGWTYTTVAAEPRAPLDPRPTGRESAEVRWVDTDEVAGLPLHPGFSATWPRLRAASPGLVIVVDAANVVGAEGGTGWWRDRAGAARRLRARLAPLPVAGVPAADVPAPVDGAWLDVLLPQVVLVVEGAARPVAADPDGAVEVVAAGGAGDDAIVRTAAGQAGHPVLVVTADRALRERVRRVGAECVGPSWLLGISRPAR
jgi:8-oxo-dGTP diphosphatase